MAVPTCFTQFPYNLFANSFRANVRKQRYPGA